MHSDRRRAALALVYLEKYLGFLARLGGCRVQADLFQAASDLKLMLQPRSVFSLVHDRIPLVRSTAPASGQAVRK
jgi:hypothetical protein